MQGRNNNSGSRPSSRPFSSRPTQGGYNRFSNNRNQQNDKHIVNRQITAPEVRVIGADGEQLGVLRTSEALRMAEDIGLDLVMVAVQAEPPVCKIIDLGKLKYKEQKRAAEIKKKSAVQETKEIRLRYNTDHHDLETKIKNARNFLHDGDKVRFSMRFKGREAMYANLGNEIFDNMISQLEEIAQVDERTRLQGQKMLLVLAPKAGVRKK